MAAKKRPASVKGTVRAPAPPKGDQYKVEHSEYWDKALNNALRAAAAEWSRGTHDVAIHQYATLTVSGNPGSGIHDYSIVVTKI